MSTSLPAANIGALSALFPATAAVNDDYKIVGTAGHIDHGKSALVEALTGTDPDRLQEERDRGITIDLGFAYADLNNGMRVGFVDVPGHERFVKNMLAGIGGIDAVVLVVAADESIKPQTLEHLAICQLLGVDRGVVAITKCDLVDEEIVELVELEVRELLDPTPLADATVVATSATTGAGLDDLRIALATALDAAADRPDTALVRLPIDRVFTLRGFGTIVTGTLLSGSIHAGDRLELLPGGEPLNVRGVQVYGATVEAATPGQRTAVNLPGVEVEAVNRGDLLVTPGALVPSPMIDARVRMLPGHGLEHLQRARFHHGAAEILCRVAMLGDDAVGNGGTALVQIRLETPYACVPGDRFVLRRYSPMVTIGGGIVLDNAPRKHRISDRAARDRVAALEDATPEERLALLVADAGAQGAPESALRQRMFVSREELVALAEALAQAGRVLIARQQPLLLVDAASAATATATLRQSLTSFHRQNPLAAAAPKSTLAAALPVGVAEATLEALIATLVHDGVVEVREEGVALADHQVELSPTQRDVRDALLRRYAQAGWSPPTFSEALEESDATGADGEQILHMLLRSGDLVRVRSELVMHAERLEELIDRLRERYLPGTAFDVADFKDWTGLSRKYAIPLLEYLDEHRVTRREGDRRVRI